MHSSQHHHTASSSDRFARLSRMMASFEAELRQRTSGSDSDDKATDVIEQPCRLAPAVLRRRRAHQ